ncbi:MAG: myo-inositol 2-dehydrogenase/D-chiro-inositol 1-dehydrogenase [Verrucomicrobiales bacterium]|jgi:myo-inositol 2-dehydrogenase/D-chiro-inositol 1-dehydrogenase
MSSPSPPLRIGTVGLGRLGRFHAETIAHRIQGVTLASVCSVTPSDLEWAQTTFPETPSYTDFDTMLEKATMDAVVLSSPSALHCRQILQALEAGLHVFSEKPLGGDVSECQSVVAAEPRFPEQVVMLGFMRRYDPSYLDVKARLEAGEIGRPILFRSYSVDPSSAIEGALAYLPHSAGQFLDMAVHDIDLARWLLQSEPRMVTAAGGCYAHPEFAEYDDGDNVAAFLQFENDAMGFLLAGRTAAHGYQVETEIIGTKGSLRVGAVPQKNLVEILDGHGVRQLCSQSFLERFEQAYVNELRAFVECIREKRPSEVTVHNGLRATEIALAAQTSFREGRMISF